MLHVDGNTIRFPIDRAEEISVVDLLKRPLDAFKYLQLSIETGEVSLGAQNLQLNCVMLGSANELHLDAFREPELVQLTLVGVDDTGEVHHLGEAEHSSASQKTLEVAALEWSPRRLELGGRDA